MGKKRRRRNKDENVDPLDPSSTNLASEHEQTKRTSVPHTHVDTTFTVTVTKDTEGVDEAEEKLQKLHATKVYRCFHPYKWFMCVFFRFPLSWRRQEDLVGGYSFYYNPKSINSIGFCATSVIIAIVTFLFIINLIGSFLNVPKLNHNLNFELMYIVRRNSVPVIILLTCLTHSTIASWQFFKVRHFAASYFTFWTEMVEIVRIDVASGVPKYMSIVLISYAAFLALFVFICALRFAPVAGGGPGILAILCTRIFYSNVHTHPDFWVLRDLGGVLFFYIMICSKSFMLLFLLICRLLKNSFVVWNQRLERALIKDDDKAPRWERVAHRTGYDHLFKDHVCLLDMLEGANSIFANGIETYYSTQIISVIFEIYYFYKTQSDINEFKGVRRFDGIIIALYLLHSVLILLIVSISASEVGEEAMEGLEIIRKKGMMREMDDDELYFMLSMYTSYTGHIQTAITGDGYFTLDKGFLVAIAGTVFSYFIILIQFSPSLSITVDMNKEVRTYPIAKLLHQVEGTKFYGASTANLTTY